MQKLNTSSFYNFCFKNKNSRQLIFTLLFIALLTFLLLGYPDRPTTLIASIKNKNSGSAFQEFQLPSVKLAKSLAVNPCDKDFIVLSYDNQTNIKKVISGLNVFRSKLRKVYKNNSQSFSTFTSEIQKSETTVNTTKNICLFPLSLNANVNSQKVVNVAKVEKIKFGDESVYCAEGKAVASSVQNPKKFYESRDLFANYAGFIKEKQILIDLKRRRAKLQSNKKSISPQKKKQIQKIDIEIRKINLSIAYADFFSKDGTLLANFYDSVCKNGNPKPHTKPTESANNPEPTAIPAGTKEPVGTATALPTQDSNETPASSNCTGSATQICPITNGAGSQSRTCSSGNWSGWSVCTLTSCSSGYHASGNSCVANNIVTKFKIGDRIQLNEQTNVRATGSLTGTLLGTQPVNSIGTIVAGPTAADNIVWWQINFDSGTDGITGENHYEIYTSCTNGQTQPRTYFREPSVPSEQSCVSESQTWTCVNSQWTRTTGTFTNSNCYVENPPTQNDCATGSSSSINQWGVNWQFDKAYPCGQFVNGDYWVAPIAGYNNNKVKITRITPDYANGRNGWEVNPKPCDTATACGSVQGYTNQVWGSVAFDSNLIPPLNPNAGITYDAAVGSSIVKAVAHTTAPNCQRKIWNGYESGYLSLNGICENGVGISTVAVLTVVGSNANGTFRPPYSGTWKPTISYNDVVESRLLSLDPPAVTIKSMAELATKIEKLQLDDGGWSWNYTQVMPVRNFAGGYGAVLVGTYAEVILRLQLNDNIAVKRDLLKKMIQVGIDYYGLLKAGKYWQPDGGHFAKAKLPIVFAGYMLGNPDMLNVKQKYPNHWLFQEDCNWFYTQDNPPYAEQPKVCYPSLPEAYRTPGKGFARFGSRSCDGYRQAAFDPDYFGEPISCVSGASNTYWGENVASQRGNAIAIELLGLKAQWGNDAFFDHMNWTYKSGILGNAAYGVQFSNAMYGKYHK